jgi:hypothetical protein
MRASMELACRELGPICMHLRSEVVHCETATFLAIKAVYSNALNYTVHEDTVDSPFCHGPLLPLC